MSNQVATTAVEIHSTCGAENASAANNVGIRQDAWASTLLVGRLSIVMYLSMPPCRGIARRRAASRTHREIIIEIENAKSTIKGLSRPANSRRQWPRRNNRI